MTGYVHWVRVFLLVGCLAAIGCGEKEKAPPKVIKIGDPNTASAPAAPNAGNAGPLPGGGGGQPAPVVAAESPKRARRKPAADLDFPEDRELGTGQQRFAVLPASSPGGIAFAINAF